MIESIDARLREVGINDTDVQTRLDGKDKALVITDQDIIYVDTTGLQRSGLRFVTKVITDKTGALTIRSSSGPAIEGSIRGFDVTELKVFFEGVKTAIARAKTAPEPAQAPLGATPGALDLGAPLGRTSTPSAPEPHFEPPPLSAQMSPPSAHLDPTPEPMLGRMPASASAMDPWESLSTSRPTLEMPAAPGVLPGFSDALDHRPNSGRLSPDSLDWDEPINDHTPTRSAPSAFHDLADDEPMLEPDDLPPTPRSAPSPASSTGVMSGALAPAPSDHEQWSGDALDQPISNAVASSPAPTLADHYAISPVSRWLKILAIPLGLIGIAAGALSVPATDNPSILQWLQVAGFIVGGITMALISYGIGDLLAIWASMATDVRAIRRNQIK